MYFGVDCFKEHKVKWCGLFQEAQGKVDWLGSDQSALRVVR